ncbi:MAG TPA: DUF3857 and transglutaminase domain-containing protein [Candidatus Acidoferrum sp.]|nr:DUF3857 and transglutaminase domain-containing protein [Candidatus Acidoferrum sp.]
MRRLWRIKWFLIAASGLATVAPDVRADAPAWMHTAASAPLPAYDAKTDAVLLYSEDVTTVMPDGKIKSTERRAYKILRPDGRDYAAAWGYTSPDSKIGSMRGWCIPAQGKDYEVKDKDAQEKSLSVFNGELASDLKVRFLRIPAGEPGNVVGYEIQYDGRPFVLEDVWNFQSEVPVKEARYTLQMPPGWEYKVSWLNHAKVEPTASGTNQWQWVLTDLPAIRPERYMPPFKGVSGRMTVAFLAPGEHVRSGFLTWSDMGKWEGDLTSGKREVNPLIAQKVAEITAGKTTLPEKMRSITEFMQKDIRYVAIELGIGGYQPHSAMEIFTHRYGDCKDKATLLSTMLKQIGVDSYYVVINDRHGAVRGDSAPDIGLFNHVILAIQLPDQLQDGSFQAVLPHAHLGRLLIFDPTNEKIPIGKLPGYLQSNHALLVAPNGGGELLQMPQLPTASSGIVRTGKLALDAEGTLKAEITETRKGDLAATERQAQISVASSKDRVKAIEREVSHSIGMFQIASASMTGLEANEAPFEYSYSFVAPAYAKQAGNLLVVRPRVMGVKASDLLEAKDPRKFPVIFEGPEKDTDTFEITLPMGYEVDDLPPAVDLDYSFGSYHSKTETSGNKLKYTRTFEIKELSVPMEKMDDLKKFYRVIASDERNTAVLKPSTAAASAR